MSSVQLTFPITSQRFKYVSYFVCMFCVLLGVVGVMYDPLVVFFIAAILYWLDRG